MFAIQNQWVDVDSGFHVIELRSKEGGGNHIVQIAIGHDSCPACGVVYPKDNTGKINPFAMVQQVAGELETSRENVLAYAAKHRVRVK